MFLADRSDFTDLKLAFKLLHGLVDTDVIRLKVFITILSEFMAIISPSIGFAERLWVGRSLIEKRHSRIISIYRRL